MIRKIDFADFDSKWVTPKGMSWLIHPFGHGSFWVPKSVVGPIRLTWHPMSTWMWVTPVHIVRLSYQTDWRDSKRPELKNGFQTGSFLNFLLKRATYDMLKTFSCSPAHIQFCRFDPDPMMASIFSLTSSHLPSRSTVSFAHSPFRHLFQWNIFSGNKWNNFLISYISGNSKTSIVTVDGRRDCIFMWLTRFGHIHKSPSQNICIKYKCMTQYVLCQAQQVIV
jgi:hypothetical protein